MRKSPPSLSDVLLGKLGCGISSQGYSLIELLLAAAIISLMTGLGAESLTGNHSANLNSGGNLVVEMAVQARENSMSKNTMTALVMDSGGRHFILMEYTGTEWTAMTRWQALPQNVKVDTTASQTSFPSLTPAITLDHLPPCSGSSVLADACSYQVFLPNGRLSVSGVATPSSPSLRLVEVNTPGDNYYNISLNYLTGIAKVSRP